MNVILEVSVPDVVDVLADHKTDAAYKKSMEEAKKESADEGQGEHPEL